MILTTILTIEFQNGIVEIQAKSCLLSSQIVACSIKLSENPGKKSTTKL